MTSLFPHNNKSKTFIAVNIMSKDGAKPQKEYSPGQRPGYKCTYYPARCKRNRS